MKYYGDGREDTTSLGTIGYAAPEQLKGTIRSMAAKKIDRVCRSFVGRAHFATIQTEGNRQVTRDMDYYNFDELLACIRDIRSSEKVFWRKTKAARRFL